MVRREDPDVPAPGAERQRRFQDLAEVVDPRRLVDDGAVAGATFAAQRPRRRAQRRDFFLCLESDLIRREIVVEEDLADGGRAGGERPRPVGGVADPVPGLRKAVGLIIDVAVARAGTHDRVVGRRPREADPPGFDTDRQAARVAHPPYLVREQRPGVTHPRPRWRRGWPRRRRPRGPAAAPPARPRAPPPRAPRPARRAGRRGGRFSRRSASPTRSPAGR